MTSDRRAALQWVVMRKFEDLTIDDQNRLLVALLYAMSKAHCKSIDELAKKN